VPAQKVRPSSSPRKPLSLETPISEDSARGLLEDKAGSPNDSPSPDLTTQVDALSTLSPEKKICLRLVSVKKRYTEEVAGGSP
jgi:hypothetical protein